MYFLLELENFSIDSFPSWDSEFMTLSMLTCHAAVAQLEVLALKAPVVTEVTDRALHTRVLGTSSLYLNFFLF